MAFNIALQNLFTVLNICCSLLFNITRKKQNNPHNNLVPYTSKIYTAETYEPPWIPEEELNMYLYVTSVPLLEC